MCVCIKCIKSAKKHIQKCEIEIIDKGKYFWVNRRDLEKILLEIKSDYKIGRKCLTNTIQKNQQKYRHELIPDTNIDTSTI